MDLDPRAQASPHALDCVQRDNVWVAAYDAARYVMAQGHERSSAYADAVICALMECGAA